MEHVLNMDNNNESNKLECFLCRKSFKNRKTIQKHARNFHPEFRHSFSLKEGKEYKFQCELCSKKFTHKFSLRSHLKHIHNEIVTTKITELNCPICSNKDTKAGLKVHFETHHHIPVEEETLLFNSKEEFLAWKTKYEEDQASLFVKERGSAGNTLGEEKSFFKCHRSGYFKCKGKGLRPQKAEGTKKINGYCPARMVVTNSDDGCIVHLTKTHVGHTNETQRLLLRSSNKKTNETQRLLLRSSNKKKTQKEELIKKFSDLISSTKSRSETKIISDSFISLEAKILAHRNAKEVLKKREIDSLRALFPVKETDNITKCGVQETQRIDLALIMSDILD